MYQTQLCLNVPNEHNIYGDSNFNQRKKSGEKHDNRVRETKITRKKGELSDGGIIGAGGSPN